MSNSIASWVFSWFAKTYNQPQNQIRRLFQEPEKWEERYDDEKAKWVFYPSHSTMDSRYKLELSEKGESFNRNADAAWLPKTPDPHAYKYQVKVLYGDEVISEEFYIVSYDGGRYWTPIPTKSRQEKSVIIDEDHEPSSFYFYEYDLSFLASHVIAGGAQIGPGMDTIEELKSSEKQTKRRYFYGIIQSL